MKKASSAVFGVVLCLLTALAVAQDVKPYKEGPVTEVSYIKVKPGHFNEYMRWLSTQYKQLMEANKKAGLIVGYAVYSAQARSPKEPDLILTVTYANMAALDRIEEGEALATKVMGSMSAQDKAFADRGAMREVLGSELIRELILK
jgi:L-rhamnose mutarotase